MSVFSVINIITTLLPLIIQAEPQFEKDVKDILALIDKITKAAKEAEAK